MSKEGRADRVTQLHSARPDSPGCAPNVGETASFCEGSGSLDRVDVNGDAFAAAPIRGGSESRRRHARGFNRLVSEASCRSSSTARARPVTLPAVSVYAVPLTRTVPMKLDCTS